MQQDLFGIQSAHEVDLKAKKEAASRPHVSNNSGNNEWYTPPLYLEAARKVMGTIDVDPCSSVIAQENVKAAIYFTANDDGLNYEWPGNVWMNPPYSSGLVGLFIEELGKSLSNRTTRQAVVLVNNATETAWGQHLLSFSSAVCFPSRRIRFLDKSGKPAKTPLQGQMIAYAGSRNSAFCQVFKSLGICMKG